MSHNIDVLFPKELQHLYERFCSDSSLQALHRHYLWVTNILGKTSIISFVCIHCKNIPFWIGLPNIFWRLFLQPEGRYSWKLKLKYLQMFLQNCEYIQSCQIQSFLVTLGQLPCFSIILAAHLQKTCKNFTGRLEDTEMTPREVLLLQWGSSNCKRHSHRLSTFHLRSRPQDTFWSHHFV